MGILGSYCCDRQTSHPKAAWGGEGLFQLTDVVHPEGKLGLKQRPWAVYWLIPYGLLSLLSYTIQDHVSRGTTTHSGLGPHTSIINQEKWPTGVSAGQFDEDDCSVETSSSQIHN